jgi:sec-independent protein translocase protein TatC
MMTANDSKSLFWEHIEALRQTFIRILALIATGTILSFFFYNAIISFLTSPLIKAKLSRPSVHWTEERIDHIRVKNEDDKTLIYQFPNDLIEIIQMSANIEKLEPNSLLIPPKAWLIYTQPTNAAQLIVLGPLEGMLIALKTSLWVGIVTTSPLWLFVLFQFIVPGLHDHEKSLILPFLLTSLILMGVGVFFAFYVTIPLANEYLSSFNQAIGINLWSLESYLNYTFFLLSANALAFEFFVIGIFGVHLGIVKEKWLRSHRRLAIVIAFIMGAFLTPPDVVTQLLLAIPLIILYEMIIVYARLRNSPFFAGKA